MLPAAFGDEILPDLNSGVSKTAPFAMNGERVVGGVAHRIGLVVADHEFFVFAQQIAQQMCQGRLMPA